MVEPSTSYFGDLIAGTQPADQSDVGKSNSLEMVV